MKQTNHKNIEKHKINTKQTKTNNTKSIKKKAKYTKYTILQSLYYSKKSY